MPQDAQGLVLARGFPAWEASSAGPIHHCATHLVLSLEASWAPSAVPHAASSCCLTRRLTCLPDLTSAPGKAGSSNSGLAGLPVWPPAALRGRCGLRCPEAVASPSLNVPQKPLACGVP